MFERIYVQHFMALNRDTREKLAVIFTIPRSGITEIRDETVVTDGRTNEDLTAISKDKMSAYTGLPATESFNTLWNATLEKLNNPAVITSGEIKSIEEMPKRYCDFCVSTKGRHRKGCPKYK